MKRSPIRKVSVKKQRERVEETKLYWKLYTMQKGKCADCGGRGDFRGLRKHEIIFRSQGGSPVDETNTVLLCGKCHSLRHGIHET